MSTGSTGAAEGSEEDGLYSPAERSLYTPQAGSVINSEASFTLSNASFGDVTTDRVEHYLRDVGNLELSLTPRTARSDITSLHSEPSTLRELEDMEVMKRSEIYAGFAVTSRMIHLAARRIVPMMRKRRARKTAKPLVVVHHKDIDISESIRGRPCHLDPMPALEQPSAPQSSASPERSPRAATPEKVTEPEEEEGGLQLLELSATSIDASKKSKPIILHTWDHLSAPGASEHLSSGGTYFRFVCRTISKLDDADRDLIRPHINRTQFKDELKENGVPYIDIDNPVDTGINLWTFIGVRTTYILPGVKLATINTKLLSSQDYHRNCQPGPPKVYDDVTDPDTVRFSKVIVKFIFTLTLQLRVSEITDHASLKQFEHIDGMVPAKVILMERTKRNVEVKDSTAKCKSYLLYYPITGGVLVSGITLVISRSVARVVASVVNTFGGQGNAEAGETADKTRAYLLKTFGDSRQE